MSGLKDFLILCKQEYYAGKPIISDSQFDELEQICLEDLDVGTNKGRIKHWYKMYSLQKFYTDEDIPFNLKEYQDTPKLDGASLSLRYINGWSDSIVTRGNGEYGEDVTHLFNLETCEKLGIPLHIYYNKEKVKGICQITGEICAKSNIPNARNYAAGALNLKSARDFEEKELEFFAYDMQGQPPAQHYLSTLKKLEKLGFNTVRSRKVQEYPQDGTVWRLKSNSSYEKLGFTSKHPRGAFALKERSEGILTTLLDVKWETGKSGKVTPVAVLDPIYIDGALVSRATLNNPGFIEAMDLHIGDKIMVERAGGIIPRIIKKVELEEIHNQQKNSS
jgi:DNA ligase (NAD+)